MAVTYLVKNAYDDEVIERLHIETKAVDTFIRWLIDNEYLNDGVYFEEVNEDVETHTF